MDAKTYLQKQIKQMWGLQDSVIKGLSDALLNKEPEGTASPAGVIWLHSTYSEDSFIGMLSGEAKLWDTGNWQSRFGLETAPNYGEDWQQYHQAPLTVADLQAYTEAVRAQTTAVLDAMTDEDLDDTVKFFTESDPKADVWTLLVAHSLHHFGEIAAIIGVMGGKGLPF